MSKLKGIVKKGYIKEANKIVSNYKKERKAKIYVLGYDAGVEDGEEYRKEIEKGIQELRGLGYTVYSGADMVVGKGDGRGVISLGEEEQMEYMDDLLRVISKVDYAVCISSFKEKKGVKLREDHYHLIDYPSLLEGLIVGELNKPIVNNQYIIGGEVYDIGGKYGNIISPIIRIGVRFNSSGVIESMVYKGYIDESSEDKVRIKNGIQKVAVESETEISIKIVPKYSSIERILTEGEDYIESENGLGSNVMLDKDYIIEVIEMYGEIYGIGSDKSKYEGIELLID